MPRCHQAAVLPRRSELPQTDWVLPQIPCASFLPSAQEEDALLKLKTRSEKQKKTVSADRAHIPAVSPCPRHVPTMLGPSRGLGHSTSWVLQHRGLPRVFCGRPGDVVALQLSARGADPAVEPLDLLKPPLSSGFGVRGPPGSGRRAGGSSSVWSPSPGVVVVASGWGQAAPRGPVPRRPGWIQGMGLPGPGEQRGEVA